MADQNPLLDNNLWSAAPARSAAPSSSDNPLLDDNLWGKPKAQTGNGVIPTVSAPVSSPSQNGPLANWDPIQRGTDQAPMPWSQALTGAAENIIPSSGRALAGIGSAVIHPVDTASTLWNLTKGIGSKIDGLAGRPQDPAQKAQTEALANAVMAQYADKYGSWEGFKNAIANDPASVALDAATVAAPAVKVAGAIGNVAGAAGKAATTADAANAARIATPAISDALKAGTASELTAADIPAEAHAGILKILDKKGITPDALAEGVASEAAGVPVPKSVFTLEPPPPGAVQDVRATIRQGNENITQKLATLAGAEGPHSSAMGEALDQAFVNSANNVKTSYNTAFSAPGEFNPSLSNAVPQEVINSLSAVPGLPESLQAATDLPMTYPQTAAAMQYLNKTIGSLKMPGGGSSLTMPKLEAIRTELNSYLTAADGKDIRAMRAVIDGFDNALQKTAATPGGFVVEGASPADSAAAGQTVVQNMGNARAAFRDHRATFYDTSSPVSAAVKTLAKSHEIDPATGLVASGASPDVAASIQGNIGKALMNPQTGPALYNKMTGIFGEPAAPGGAYLPPSTTGGTALNDFVRQSILQQVPSKSDLGNVLKNTPQQMSAWLKSPIAKRAFSPAELRRAKFLNTGSRILNTKPTLGGQLTRSVRSAIGMQALRGGAGAVGALAGHALGLPETVTGLGGYAAERGLEAMNKSRELRGALSGAPSPGFMKRAATAGYGMATGAVTNPTAPLVLNQAANAQNAQRLPVARATGGAIKKRMSHEQLVKRLLDLAEKAKDATNDETKPLLKVPDETVVKALAVAQRAI